MKLSVVDSLGLGMIMKHFSLDGMEACVREKSFDQCAT